MSIDAQVNVKAIKVAAGGSRGEIKGPLVMLKVTVQRKAGGREEQKRKEARAQKGACHG
jgi:hypothetical protein